MVEQLWNKLFWSEMDVLDALAFVEVMLKMLKFISNLTVPIPSSDK
jgi:hypothetical protein